MSSQAHRNNTRVIGSTQQVVELTQQNITGNAALSGLDGSESDEIDNVLAFATTGNEASAPAAERGDTPQAEYVAARKSHALHIANDHGSVDIHESRSGAAAIINASRRSTNDGRLSG